MKEGHPAQVEEGHLAQVEEGHPAQVEEGHLAQVEQGHLAQVEQGHPAQVEQGHPAQVEQGHPAQVAHGYPAQEEQVGGDHHDMRPHSYTLPPCADLIHPPKQILRIKILNIVIKSRSDNHQTPNPDQKNHYANYPDLEPPPPTPLPTTHTTLCKQQFKNHHRIFI